MNATEAQTRSRRIDLQLARTGWTTDTRTLMVILHGEKSRAQLPKALFLRGRAIIEERDLEPALESGFIEPAIPTKHRSRFQQHRLTAKRRPAH